MRCSAAICNICNARLQLATGSVQPSPCSSCTSCASSPQTRRRPPCETCAGVRICFLAALSGPNAHMQFVPRELVRAVSAANMRMLGRQPATGFTPAREQGKLQCLTTRLCHMKQWLVALLILARRAVTSEGWAGILCQHLECPRDMWLLRSGEPPFIRSLHEARHLCQPQCGAVQSRSHTDQQMHETGCAHSQVAA